MILNTCNYSMLPVWICMGWSMAITVACTHGCSPGWEKQGQLCQPELWHRYSDYSHLSEKTKYRLRATAGWFVCLARCMFSWHTACTPTQTRVVVYVILYFVFHSPVHKKRSIGRFEPFGPKHAVIKLNDILWAETSKRKTKRTGRAQKGTKKSHLRE